MNAFRPFFPRLLLDRATGLDPSGPALILPGACLFADVSGFTAMSEALLAMGKEGSEVLTKVLNGFYAELVEAALANGGDVMRFAGDAVTVHFPDEATALRAGLAMQGLMPRFCSIPTPAGEFTLRMKAGVATGEAHFFLVEGAGRRDYVYSGDPVDGSAEAEHHAEAGEVVAKRGVGFDKILDASGESKPPDTQGELASGDILAPFLHPLLWEALAAGQAALLNEHRHLSVLFVSFRPQDGGEVDPVAGVRSFYQAAAERVAEYDGYINKVDMGDKGSKLLVLFGAPRAHEDDEARALACARALGEDAKAAGFAVRMGLNAAKVFCGVVGSGERCEYTVMGDGVNVAARLMQAAPEGGCLASPAAKARSGGRFAFRDLPPLPLKGKKEPIPVHLLEGLKGTEEELPFFIGREAEEGALLEAIQAQPKDQAGLYVITGEAGVGKTAFVTWFLNRHLKDHRIIRHHCASHAANIPYSAFRAILPELLAGKDAAVAAREVIERRDPEIVEYLPILLNTFGLTKSALEEPPLEPEVRRALLWKMVRHIVDAVLARIGLILVIDGGQWLDVESRALLVHLVRISENGLLRLFFTQRAGTRGEEGLYRIEIALNPFGEEGTQAFLEAALSVDDVPVEAVKKVFSSSHGNSLLAKEMLALLFQSGYLSRDEEYPQILLVDESRSFELPDSIGGLVLSRLDALSFADRTILRTLAVVGERIPAILIEGLGIDANRVFQLAINELFITSNEDRSEYRFLQVDSVAAIYDSIEFMQRREMHYKIATWIRLHSSESPGHLNHILAHHLSKAGLSEAIPYLLKVAEEAKSTYSIPQAIQALEEAVRVAEDDLSAIGPFLTDLGQLLLLTGRATDLIKTIEPRLDRLDDFIRSGVQRVLAEAYLATGQVHQAELMLERIISDSLRRKEVFLALCLLGKLYGRTGRIERAAKTIEKAMNMGQEFAEEKEYKLNLMRIAFMEYQSGRTNHAIVVFRRLERDFEKAGDIVTANTIRNNLGVLLSNSGQNRKALKHFMKYYQVTKKYGIWDPEIHLKLLDNIGLQYLELGKWKEAELYLKSDLAYSKKYSMEHMYKPMYLMGETAIYRGKLIDAFVLLSDARAACKRHHIPSNEVLEQLMNLALIFNSVSLFRSFLKEYQEVIAANNMGYLESELLNYQAEGTIRFQSSNLDIGRMQDLLRDCLQEESYIEAYRAARTLLLYTKDTAYLKKMATILDSCTRMLYRVEYCYFVYQFHPNQANRSKLLSTIARYPFADIVWRAYVEIAKHDASVNRKKKLDKALSATDIMLQGLSIELVRGFKIQPQYTMLIELMQREERPEGRECISTDSQLDK